EAEEFEHLLSQLACFEGQLLKENSNIARDSMAQLRLGTGDDVVVAANVDAYMTMFRKLLVNQERGVHWSQMYESLLGRLREVPKVGEESWRTEVMNPDRLKLLTSMQWKMQRMMATLELSFSKATILDVDELKMLKGLRVDKALHGALISQAELDKPNTYSVEEQIAVLENALREQDKALDKAGYVESAGLAVEQGVYFEQFLDQIKALRESTESRMTG